VEKQDRDPRLTQLTTQWDLIVQAHRGTPEQVSTAQVELMNRYAGAVHRYLLAALRDPEAAAELGQEFALRFLRGDFRNVDPARGRFRDFVKQALRNLMIDYHRRRKVRPRPMGDDLPEPAAPEDSDFDCRFVASWRSELMSRAWAALAQLQERTAQPYYTVLRLRVEHPEMRSPELARQIATTLRRPVTAGGLRMALKRSRDQFVGFLLQEVAGTLRTPGRVELEEELSDLDLLTYCRSAMERLGPT
jgi:RNA polymerase sigma-70 factor (ECF subfamily)